MVITTGGRLRASGLVEGVVVMAFLDEEPADLVGIPRCVVVLVAFSDICSNSHVTSRVDTLEDTICHKKDM